MLCAPILVSPKDGLVVVRGQVPFEREAGEQVAAVAPEPAPEPPSPPKLPPIRPSLRRLPLPIRPSLPRLPLPIRPSLPKPPQLIRPSLPKPPPIRPNLLMPPHPAPVTGKRRNWFRPAMRSSSARAIRCGAFHAGSMARASASRPFTLPIPARSRIRTAFGRVRSLLFPARPKQARLPT